MDPTDANEESVQDSNNAIDNAGSETAAQEPSGADELATDNLTSTPLNLGHSDAVIAENELNQPAENTTIPPSPNIEVNTHISPEPEEPEDSIQEAGESHQTETNAPVPTSLNSPSSPASDSSSSTLVGSEDSYRSSADTSILAPPNFAISARSEVNSLGCAPISVQFSSNTSGSTNTPTTYTVTAESSASVFYSRLETPHSMNDFSASANATTRAGSVRFQTLPPSSIPTVPRPNNLQIFLRLLPLKS